MGSWELLVILPDEPARVATRLPTTAAGPANSLKVEPGRDEQPGRLRPTGGPDIHDRMMEPWHPHPLSSGPAPARSATAEGEG